MDDGRYAVVTADERDGHEGQYRLGFSETAEFDGDRMKIMEGVSLESLKKDLTGIADGSIVVGENRLEYAKTQENAPASGEGVVNGQVMAESANEAQRAEFGGVSAEENSLRRAINPNFSNEYDRWDKKSTGGYFKLGTTGQALASVGINPSKIYWDKSKIKEVLNKHPEMDDNTIKQVPNLLENPILIMQSQTAVNRVVLLGEVYGTNGAPVLAALELRPNGNISDFVKLTSAYGKGSDKNGVKWSRESVQNLINESDILYVDPNKKRTDSWLQTLRLQLPAGVTNYGSLHSVSQFDRNVNGEIVFGEEKNTETPMARKIREAQKKVVEKEGAGRSALPMQRARGDQTKTQAKAEKRIAAEQVAEQRRGEQETAGASPTEGTTERTMPSRGYTDAEANEARGLVSDFDLLPPSVRRSIIELVRSGKKSGASKNFLRHSANLIAYWRRGLWVIADDKTRDDGFYTVFSDGSRLIVVKPNREAKAVSETLMHELGHDVWARADEKTRKVLYELATEGVKQEEIDAIRERYREELTKRGEIPEKAGERSKAATTESESNGRSPHPPLRRSPFPAGEGLEMTEAEVEALLDEEVATNLMGEIIGKEEFLKRFDGSETSALKRILRTLSNMKKRFTGKDKYLYRKADDLFKAFTKVMAMEEVGTQAGGARTRHMFAGKEAKTANKMKLATAQEMLEQGVDSETVRKETGWFRGYDGKWRFEISDFEASLIENPNMEKHTDDGEVYFTGKLSDILDHKELFEAYPELKDINIVIQKTDFGVYGIYQPNSNYITLSIEHFKRATKEYYDYANGGRKAEIERIEATPEYQAYHSFYEMDDAENMDPEEWLRQEKELRDRFFNSDLGKRYYQLMWGKNGFTGEKYEFGWGTGGKETLLHELQHAIQQIEGFAFGTNTRDVDYRRNAGELEARAVEARSNLTAEQRKKHPP